MVALAFSVLVLAKTDTKALISQAGKVEVSSSWIFDSTQ